MVTGGILCLGIGTLRFDFDVQVVCGVGVDEYGVDCVRVCL